MKIETLVELVPGIAILAVLIFRCVRFRPSFRLLSPFNPETKVFYDEDHKGRLYLLLGILVALIGLPFLVISFL